MGNMTRFKISELFERDTLKKFPCEYFFKVLGSSEELKKMAASFDDTDEIEVHCVDIKHIPIIDGERCYVDCFAPVKEKNGIFFFVLKSQEKVLYIGLSENLYLTSGGPGVVAQLINGDNNAIVDYVTRNFPSLSIDDCSVLFLRLPKKCNLEEFKNKFKTFLRPLIDD